MATRSRKQRSSIDTSQEATSYPEYDSKPAAKPNQDVDDDASVREDTTISTSVDRDNEQEIDSNDEEEIDSDDEKSKVFVFQGIEYDTYQDYVDAKISRNQRRLKELDVNQGHLKSRATNVSDVSSSCRKRKQSSSSVSVRKSSRLVEEGDEDFVIPTLELDPKDFHGLCQCSKCD